MREGGGGEGEDKRECPVSVTLLLRVDAWIIPQWRKMEREYFGRGASTNPIERGVADAYKEFNEDCILVVLLGSKADWSNCFERPHGSSGTHPREQPNPPDSCDSNGRQVPGPESSPELSHLAMKSTPGIQDVSCRTELDRKVSEIGRAHV